MEPSRSGLVLLNSSFSVIAADAEAVQILTFPEKGKNGTFFQGRVQSRLLDQNGSPNPSFIDEFRSGNRSYRCHPFYFDRPNGKDAQPAVALLLQRKNGVVCLSDVANRFALTTRERETVELLLRGLTSKEIADRMKISPNTVKAFLRLVMVKMGVSTRAGVVGRILSPHS